MTMTKYLRALVGLLLAAAWLVCGPARAADTDVFANPNSGYNAPNVLFVIDTGASFSASNSTFRCGIDASGNVYTTSGTVVTSGTGKNATALDQTNGGVEQCALYSVIKSVAAATATVNIGVMLFNSQQRTMTPATDGSTSGTFTTECTGGGGGCLALPMTPLNTKTAPSMLNWVKNWVTSGNSDYLIKSPANRGDGATMQEAWAYFTGHTGISGRKYTAPTSPCGNNYVVFIGNAYDTQASPKDTTNDANSPYKAIANTFSVLDARASPLATKEQIDPIIDTRSFTCGASTTLKSGTVSGDEGKGAYALNWARYMAANGIKSYSVGITGPSCDTTYVAQLDMLGSSEIGRGKYFNTTNFDDLVKALKTVLGEIQSVNSVFAAVSLPVSVNQQGSYLNQVFVGMFRPQKNFLPQWTGNLKQFKLGMVNGVLRLQDADDVGAINPQTGFITECARSFWTTKALDTYWSLNPMGGCIDVASSKVSNWPDGNIVEKGAQAFTLRATDPANRPLKTCDPAFATCSSFTSFDTTNNAITQSLLGAADSTERDGIINFIRGYNVDDDLSKGTSAFRPYGHGDVVHSRPVPINHGTDTDPNIVVYYGGNDFVLRAINGNRTADLSTGGTPAGNEVWSFVPPEFYGKLRRLRKNETAIYYPDSNVPGATDKDYGVDGPITSFQGTVVDASKTFVYATMRRGGRFVYAFDVTAPADPKILWKRGCPNLGNDTDCSSEYTQMGQTWSPLKPMYAWAYGNGDTPLMIMGGGYDACEDYDAKVSGGKNHNCTLSGTKGNRIYVIEANSGKRVARFATDRAVTGEVTLVRDDSNKVLYGYAADLGGNVYRITFGDATTKATDGSSGWTITKIAALGCATATGCSDSTPNRKFMFAPSVATPDTIGSAGATYYIAIGSGDREKPVYQYLATTSMQNYFFVIKDRPDDANWLAAEASNCNSSKLICMNSLVTITGTANPSQADLDAKPKGWALQLDSTEQVVTSAVTIYGVVTFSTHMPALSTASNVCKTDLGITRVYNISYLNAAPVGGTSRWQRVSGDGLPPSPVAGQVRLDDGSQVPFCIGCSKDSPLEGAPPLTLSTVTQPKGRLYWYKER